MINANDLWKKRAQQYTKEIRRYLRYMLNDHLLIALIFFTGGAAYYYNRWLEDLPENFPYALIIALVLAFVLTNSTVQTLLKEPDLVFLLPIEKKLTAYFQKAFFFSFFVQSYVLLLVIAIISPLYVQATRNSFGILALLFAVVLLAKVWNLVMTWNIHYFNETWTHRIDQGTRLLLNFALCYFLFSGAHILFILTIVIIMISLLVYFQKVTVQKGLKWDTLIELESKRMMTFYRIANLFTDVPKLKERIKRRSWLHWVTTFVGFSKKSSFSYLYLRTFIRSSDYFGMYLRLSIIGGLVLYFMPLESGKIVIGLLFIYITGYQLMTLWRHHHLKIWISLYPIATKDKQQSFLKLMLTILMVQMLIFTLCLVLTAQFMLAMIFIIVGAIFTYGFVFYYVKAKIVKLS